MCIRDSLPGSRWLPVVMAILCVHLVHVPYWYAGIMDWHYVFEPAPLWCLLVAGVTVRLWQEAGRVGRQGVALAWVGLLLVTPVTSYLDFEPVWAPSRVDAAVNNVGFAPASHAEFRKRVSRRAGSDPALVLVKPDPTDRHIDFVDNKPMHDTP